MLTIDILEFIYILEYIKTYFLFNNILKNLDGSI